ncbi:hypothetical protein LWI29_004041 [Acer saccharum]|uniref:Uncharacterized protein n=1 Tax=Acer saccharum TaxID=4024 RepID=A0AA39S2N7_ACESA|nr:hypothetical protein LWI29_004041 [Acer saccharum]
MKNQVEDLQNLETNKRRIGKGVVINASTGKSQAGDISGAVSVGKEVVINASTENSLVGDISGGGLHTDVKVTNSSQEKGSSIYKGKVGDKNPVAVTNSMEVDALVGQDILRPMLDPSTSYKEHRPIECTVLKPTTVPSINKQPNKSEDGPITKEVHSVVKWRRVARVKKGVTANFEFGKNLKLGKREIVVREDCLHHKIKKAKCSVLLGAEVQKSGLASHETPRQNSLYSSRALAADPRFSPPPLALPPTDSVDHTSTTVDPIAPNSSRSTSDMGVQLAAPTTCLPPALGVPTAPQSNLPQPASPASPSADPEPLCPLA